MTARTMSRRLQNNNRPQGVNRVQVAAPARIPRELGEQFCVAALFMCGWSVARLAGGQYEHDEIKRIESLIRAEMKRLRGAP